MWTGDKNVKEGDDLPFPRTYSNKDFIIRFFLPFYIFT